MCFLHVDKQMEDRWGLNKLRADLQLALSVSPKNQGKRSPVIIIFIYDNFEKYCLV